MKIVLLSATGFIGSVLRDEALRRRHTVTAIELRKSGNRLNDEHKRK